MRNANRTTQNAQTLRSQLVAYCTSQALVIEDDVRALVREHALITGELTEAKTLEIVAFAIELDHNLGGWFPALVDLLADFANQKGSKLRTFGHSAHAVKMVETCTNRRQVYVHVTPMELVLDLEEEEVNLCYVPVGGDPVPLVRIL